MRKKIATLLLALVMCLSLCTPAMATKSPLGKSETADNTALVVSDDVTARIFGKYAKEIELIEDYAGRSVTHLTRDNLNVIKYVAALHHDDDEYDFPALMTDLAVACTEARLGVNTQAAPDGETNNAVTVLAANDILAGKHIRDVTAGVTATITEVYSVKGGFSHLQRNDWRLICGRMAAGGKGIIQAESSRANKRCDSQICYRTSDYQN